MKSAKSVSFAYRVIFCIMFVLCGIAVVCLAIGSTTRSIYKEEFDKTYSYADGWHTNDGAALDEKAMQKINSVSDADEISVYNTLPENNGAAFAFRAKNVFYEVYINGELVYKPEFAESPLYTKSTGTRWNLIDITPEMGGQEIEIRVQPAYENARCGIDEFRIGSSAGIVLGILGDKLVSFVTCVILLFFGLLLIIADIPINMRTQKNHELLFLGLFAICVASWCLTELHIIELFFDNSRLMQFISCVSLMLIPFALILYLNEAMKLKTRMVIFATSGLCVLGFTASWVLHFLKIKDIHETLIFAHINIGIAACLLVYFVIKNAVTRSKKQGAKVYIVIRAIGLSCIAVAAVVDMIRYYSGNTDDSAMFVRIGLLIFVLCYGSASLENTIKAVKKGVQAEFISRLAYHDGLTGAGNRTAFEERLAALETEKSDDKTIGIVMFDINDLKFVNDNLGHPLGDSMIKKAAEIIGEAFGAKEGECFRIGGDEFAVVMRENAVERYESGMRKFAELCDTHNADPTAKFRISIASGFFVYDKDCGFERITDAYKKADERMYENKRAIKANQIPPQEYYASHQAIS